MKIKDAFKLYLKKTFEKIRFYYTKDKVLFIGVLMLFILVISVLLQYISFYFFRSINFTMTSILLKQNNLHILENSSNRLVMRTMEGCNIWIYKDRNIQNSLDSLKRDFPIKIKEYTKENMIVYVGKHSNRSLYKMLMSFPNLEYSCVVLCYYEDIDTNYEGICKTYRV